MEKICKYNELYVICNNGNIYSIGKKERGGSINYRKKQLKSYDDGNGYFRIDITINGKRKTFKVHRLVAEHFVENRENKPQVNHIDGNKSNNHYSNLEWCSAKENIIHAYKNGLNISHMTGKFDILHPNSIKIAQLSICGVNQINVFNSVSEASRQTKINRATISECINNKRKSAGGYKWQKI